MCGERPSGMVRRFKPPALMMLIIQHSNIVKHILEADIDVHVGYYFGISLSHVKPM